MRHKLLRWRNALILMIVFYYGLPPLIHLGDTTGWMVLPALLLIFPAIAFLLCLYDGMRNGFSWILPLCAALLFLPTVFLYYNITALLYAVIYGSLGFIGEVVGLTVYRNRQENG